jgi:acetamidase/formamidase
LYVGTRRVDPSGVREQAKVADTGTIPAVARPHGPRYLPPGPPPESGRQDTQTMTHHLAASAAACHWGYFEAARKPLLTVKSGERVTIDTLTGAPEMLPPPPFHVPPEIHEVHRNPDRYPAPHILTGPVAIEGAMPGDVLEVRILDVQLRQDWGFNFIRPLGGTLPDEFPEGRILNIPLDRERMVGKLPFGIDVPLKPFFGVMGVSPPPAWGRISSVIPRAHGGNIDNKQLAAGSTLYLPVHVPGANFSCGDGHGAQGDGEVCLTAIETALTGTFEFILRKDMRLANPRAETPTHFITMGFDPSLDRCMEIALRDMLDFIVETRNIARLDAYTLCSVAADFHVTQTVNTSKGVHGMLPKALFA